MPLDFRGTHLTAEFAWFDPDPSVCPCGGSGGIVTDDSVKMRCRYHNYIEQRKGKKCDSCGGELADYPADGDCESEEHWGLFELTEKENWD